jgi:hypothetical protein
MVETEALADSRKPAWRFMAAKCSLIAVRREKLHRKWEAAKRQRQG